MNRLPNWQSRLHTYITSTAHTPFKYGLFDCGLFAAGAIEATTGIDVAAELRGYTSRRGAFQAIKATCGTATVERLAQHITAKYSMPGVPVPFAQGGDLVLIRRGQRSSLGILSMNGFEILTPSKGGLVRVALSHGTAAWRVG